MAAEGNKENIADGLVPSATENTFPMSPKKSKKARSLSMGPGSSTVLKESLGNRRKSAFPSVKPILSHAKDATAADIFKRKQARRKSLANRRVSFAPEATLHTWDVVEYMKDATSSSSSSDATRRASAVSQELSFKSPEPASPRTLADAESPSTPPKHADEIIQVESTPDSQRKIHQKKRRRSSTGMHLKNQEEIFSSSPLSDKSPAKDAGIEDSDSDDMGDATMDLDDPTLTMQSVQSPSARLDAALRQAAAQAGKRPQENQEDEGDATMEIADDEVTNAFKPWIHKNRRSSLAVQRMVASNDQENVDPFQSHSGDDMDMTQEMSMDITRAIGGIAKDDTTNNTKTVRGLKRRRSSNIAAMTESSGSPVQRPNTRRSVSKRQSLADESVIGDLDATMDFTVAVGGIKPQVNKTQQDNTEMSITDDTMDFTVAIGSIIKHGAASETGSVANTELLEDMSMEITENLGGALMPPGIPVTPSPVRSKRSPIKDFLPPSVAVERGHTPQKSPGTPKITSPSKGAVQPSPRRSTRKSAKDASIKTPDRIVARLESPIRQTSQQYSPIPKASDTTSTRIDLKKSSKGSSLTETLRLLSTPRKEILPAAIILPPPSASRTVETSPKRTIATPKKNGTPKRAITPSRSASPRKRVKINVQESPEKVVEADVDVSELSEGDKISLPDFLSMTNIRFMDLTTTKRRATGHPGAEGIFRVGIDVAEEEPSFENNAAAAVAVVPMLSMYQHSCHEMKSYISSGRTEIRNLEDAALETQPPLFHDYASASAAEKNIIDAQLRDLKTNARLQSKSGWHNWRSQLLNDLKNGLLSTFQDLEADEKLISQVESSFQGVLPALLDQEQQLEDELQRLQMRKEEQEENSGAEIENAREQLVSVEKMLGEQSAFLDHLKSDLATQQSALEDAQSWKTETLAAIQEADRISEEYRGWSVDEVRVLQDKLSKIESKSDWSLVSASKGSITLSHRDLHLTLQPSSWMTASNTPEPNSPNGPVSLSYVGKLTDDTSPQATIRRFFIQLLRAQALSLPQCHTRASSLLSLICSGWDLSARLTFALAGLQVGGVTDASIEGDERIALTRMLLLPTLETKIHVRFCVDVRFVGSDVEGRVGVEAKVMYGEKYDESKMSDFVGTAVGGKVGSLDDVPAWANYVEDLKGKLLRRGRKDGDRI